MRHASKRKTGNWLAFIAGAFAFSAVVASVPAQVMAAYPEKPIKVIVGWSAGGGADTFVRTVGKYTEKYLGAAFQPVYKKGGGGTVALNELTKNFDPDGYTIAIGIIPHQVIPTQLSDVGYKLSDLRWLATFAKVPNGVYVRHDSPYQTMKQLIAAAKAAPGKLKAALPDPRSGNTVFFNTWLSLSKIDIAPLYYGGGSKMLKAMLGKEVDMMITNANWAIRKPDDTHLLGLAADKRFALVPKVQTFHELGIDLEDFSVRTFVASAKVPGDRVKVLVEGLRKRSARIQPSRRTWRKSA